MKSMGYNPQERIRTIMNKIDVELSSLKRIQATPTPHTVVKASSNGSGHSEMSEHERRTSEAYKNRAAAAYKQKKIFTMYGNYFTIRRALIRRGWIEKLAPGKLQKLEKLSYLRLLKGARKGNEYEMAILSKLVQTYAPNLIWQPKYLRDPYAGVSSLRNRVRRTRCMDFSTKVGLIACLECSHWNTIEDVAEISYMPSYKLTNREDELYFLDNFRITQCISILNYVIERNDPHSLFSKAGIVPTSVIEFAIKKIESFVMKHKQSSLEMAEYSTEASEWQAFVVNVDLVINKGQQIKTPEPDCTPLLVNVRTTMLKALQIRPFLSSYGFKNLWILKPGFQCRGQGIVIRDSFKDIIRHAIERPKANYIVQKYIERPLLVYKTKFDIRQYMLLVVGDNISIWMYQDCYLRFSSREFSLEDLRESIHLTNNSIQKRYKNDEIRDHRLPVHNMWSLADFKKYLDEQGFGEAWQEKIYPGFKKNIVSVVLASLEETDLTPNSFEMYGCDFMLDDKLNPFLIEINSTPDLSHSTPVTARICPAAMEDLLKVVLDYRKFPNAATGKFELIYRTACPRTCKSPDLALAGTAVELHPPPPPPPIKLSRKAKVKKFLKRKILRKSRSLVKSTA